MVDMRDVGGEFVLDGECFVESIEVGDGDGTYNQTAMRARIRFDGQPTVSELSRGSNGRMRLSEALKRCRHRKPKALVGWVWCPRCGAFKYAGDAKARWIRPERVR